MQKPSKITIPRHAHPVVKVIFAAMHERRVTYVEMSERSGLSRESLTAWRVRNVPDVTSIEAVLGVLGLRFAVVDAKTGQPFEPRPETMERLGATLAERDAWRARRLAAGAARQAGQVLPGRRVRSCKPEPSAGENGHAG